MESIGLVVRNYGQVVARQSTRASLERIFWDHETFERNTPFLLRGTTAASFCPDSGGMVVLDHDTKWLGVIADRGSPLVRDLGRPGDSVKPPKASNADTFLRVLLTSSDDATMLAGGILASQLQGPLTGRQVLGKAGAQDMVDHVMADSVVSVELPLPSDWTQTVFEADILEDWKVFAQQLIERGLVPKQPLLARWNDVLMRRFGDGEVDLITDALGRKAVELQMDENLPEPGARRPGSARRF